MAVRVRAVGRKGGAESCLLDDGVAVEERMSGERSIVIIDAWRNDREKRWHATANGMGAIRIQEWVYRVD